MTLIIGPSYVSLFINVASALTRNQTSVRAKQARKRSQAQSPPAASASQESKLGQCELVDTYVSRHNHCYAEHHLWENLPRGEWSINIGNHLRTVTSF